MRLDQPRVFQATAYRAGRIDLLIESFQAQHRTGGVNQPKVLALTTGIVLGFGSEGRL